MQRLDDLQDAIQRDLVWRKRELSELRALATHSDESAEHVFRASLVMLCAHWEGFLKKSAKLYLEHVFSQDVKLKELQPHIVAVAYFDGVMGAATAKFPGSEEQHIKLAKRILATFDEKVAAPGWSVDTEGNPGSEVLARILKSVGIDAQLGMDEANWATTKVFINEQLVRDRHYIAHGEGKPIGKDVLLERIQRLLELLDTISGQVLNAAEGRTYKAS